MLLHAAYPDARYIARDIQDRLCKMNKIQLVENNLEGEFQRLNAVDDSKARLMGTI